ncbi:hypothetical protein [Streptomyces sp. NBC_00344]|uniref:hypothetical protein n=1 Tax=Streptomyces sp. NBC_00344 TaxID=2975720 RepID=UPI002E21D402
MTDRTLLLLDADGPHHPYAARLPRMRGWTTHRLHPANWQTHDSRAHTVCGRLTSNTPAAWATSL